MTKRPAQVVPRGAASGVADVTVVGEAAGTEAIRLIEQHRPEVAMLDLQSLRWMDWASSDWSAASS